MEVYKEFIPEDAMQRYEAMEAQTLAYNEEANLQVLQQSPLILQLPDDTGSGLYELPKLEGIVNLMKSKVLEMKSSPQLIEEDGRDTEKKAS